ncbi:MAG: glycosyl hydrolase-related protein [Candidatus Excrementavichristensenella sp.]|jgi:mannosylglycerate hydrolase
MSSHVMACVITHGHLDIEWYQSMRAFAFWTEEALDRLIRQCSEDEDAPSYTLDGQVFPLEQYLSMRPENESAVRELIAWGKLCIGPFYTQFDEWLPSPEAMVRNCLFGDREARKYGHPMKVGYLPDNFGHPAQLPQLLRGFGIDSLLFMRGMPYVREDYPDEFTLRGPDGSTLSVIHFRDGYSRIYGKNIQNFAEDFIPQFRTIPWAPDYISYEHYMEMTTVDDPERHAREMVDYVEKVARWFPSGVIPVMVGCDHSPPHVGLKAAVEAANRIQDTVTFVITDPEDYVRRAKGGCVHEWLDGELLGSRFQYLLLGALSTRSYLKRQNFSAEALIERYAEPLSCLAQMRGGLMRKSLLDEAWKLLMCNHAHDSVHGSSVDPVHDEMVSRYHQVEQIASGIAHQSLAHLGAGVARRLKGNEQGVLFYSPSSPGHARYVRVWLPLRKEGLHLTDESGRVLASQPIPREAPEENDLGQPSALYYPTEKLGQWLVALPEDGQALSLAMVRDGERPAIEGVRTGEDWMENCHLIVRAQGTCLCVEDKRSGMVYPGLNLLREQAEAGDFWDTSPTWLSSEEVLSSRFTADTQVVEKGPIRACMRIHWVMSVPLELTNGRRSETRADMPFTATISLYAGIPRVDVEMEFDNTARDHKISLVMPAGVRGEVFSQNAFAAFARSKQDRSHDSQCVQPATRLFPFREWLAVTDGVAGMAIAARGLYDYTPGEDAVTGQTICEMTLLRGVGNMSRINMKMRKGVAAWSAPTQSGQCPGPQRICWAYFPLDTGDMGTLTKEIEGYLYPPIAHVARGEHGASADLYPFTPVTWDTPNVRFSTLKQAEDGDGYVLRLYENLGKATKMHLHLDGFFRVAFSSLNEDKGGDVPVENGGISLFVKPFEIVTLRLWGGTRDAAKGTD